MRPNPQDPNPPENFQNISVKLLPRNVGAMMGMTIESARFENRRTARAQKKAASHDTLHNHRTPRPGSAKTRTGMNARERQPAIADSHNLRRSRERSQRRSDAVMAMCRRSLVANRRGSKRLCCVSARPTESTLRSKPESHHVDRRRGPGPLTFWRST